ncbi:MAG TPA: ATP-binding protein [Solirubrobacteraceae bacterium]|nr:ATP-binding protein [Solirubrobacteraceae bacterium]
MATVSPPLTPARWLRLPRRTARLRLTLLYSGMFLVLGTIVVVLIALLFVGSSTVVATAVRAAPGPGGGRLVFPVGIAQNQHSTDVARLLEASWVVLLLTAVGSAVLGWFIAGRVLRPLREITGTARTISAGNLHQRLALAGPQDEFKQLGDTLDDLLARLEASFESQRRFVANASHELRTPLTAERTLLQVALADPGASVESLRAMCEELLANGIEQERLLESLLTLASSERGLDRRDPIDVAALVADGVEAERPELERRGIELRSALWPAATAGNAALVERLVANLVENALEHNVQDGGYVEVRTATEGDRAVLAIANSGPVISPDQVDRLLEPFQRLDRTRRADANGHHGLGLSIVRAIATAHAAELEVSAPASGGLRVTVRFQAAP